MITIETIILMSLIVVFAYSIKGITGFGEGLFSIPLLLLFLDLKFILPVYVVIQLVADVFLIYSFRKDIDMQIIKVILVASIIGVIVGVLFLKIADSVFLKSVFGVLVVIYSLKILIFNKKRKKKEVKKNRIFGNAAGFIGGFIDAVFNTGGPPVIMYLNYVKLKKVAFRATCVTSFFVFHVTRLIMYSVNGLMEFEKIVIGLYLLPAMVIGSFIGMKVHLKINEKMFERVIGVVLLCVGVLLI